MAVGGVDPVGQPHRFVQPAPAGVDTPAWWTSQRTSLASWLNRHAPALAPLYVAAVGMVVDDSFPGRVHFVAHAVREIRNRLPEALAGEVVPFRANYRELAGVVHDRWVEAGFPLDGSSAVDDNREPSGSGPARLKAPESLLTAVGELVAVHAAASETNRDKARRMFEAVGESPPPTYVVQSWMRGTEWGPELAHVRNKRLGVEHEELLTARFATFEQAMTAIASRAYENMDALDEILESANR